MRTGEVEQLAHGAVGWRGVEEGRREMRIRGH